MVLAVIVIVVLAVIVIALISFARRRTSLRSLPDDARMRYAESWQRIEAQFVEQPQEAVHAADQLVVEVLHQRGGRDDHLPDHARRAREALGASNASGESMTEGLRRAMLDYRSAMSDLLGKDPRALESRRMEVSS